jgi:hypothetical protein
LAVFPVIPKRKQTNKKHHSFFKFLLFFLVVLGTLQLQPEKFLFLRKGTVGGAAGDSYQL